MAINLPRQATEIISRIKGDIQNLLKKTNPFLNGGLLNAMATALGYRLFDIYRNLKSQEKQFFPQTATGQYLSYFGLLRNLAKEVATGSSGTAIIQGDVNAVINENTEFSISQVNFFTAIKSTIINNVFYFSEISQVSGVATAKHPNKQPLATGITITISGANEQDYNKDFVIQVIDDNTVSFEINANAPARATTDNKKGFECSYNFALLNLNSSETGEKTNFSSGAVLTIQQNDININTNAYVAPSGIVGGSDDETEDSYRQRIIDIWQNPTTNFNPKAIEQIAKQVKGVTRVFVLRTTQGVAHGQYITDKAGYVTIYFLMDKEKNILPTDEIIAEVKNKLLDVAPVDIGEDNIIINRPVSKQVNFNISNLNPATTDMQNAIINTLNNFFRSDNNINGLKEHANNGYISLNQINKAILETVETNTGNPLINYNLIEPSQDITTEDGEIAILGSIKFS